MLLISGGGEACVAGHKGAQSVMVSCCHSGNVFHVRLDDGKDVGWQLVLLRGGMRLRGGVCADEGDTVGVVCLLSPLAAWCAARNAFF